jgi:hypothetical protein
MLTLAMTSTASTNDATLQVVVAAGDATLEVMVL